MTKSEYEEKKLELDTRHRISVQFLKQGYEAQLRALEGEWRGQTAAPPASGALRRETSAAEAAPVQHPPWFYLDGGLVESVRRAVEQLPAEFKKEDVIRLLGATPERSSLHRAMEALLVERKIRIHIRGSGRVPNVYRKVTADTPEDP